MYYNGAIKYNNVLSSAFSLIVTEVPSVVHSEIRGETFVIPGRDGELISSDTYRGNAEIHVNLAMVTSNSAANNYQDALWNVRKWLSGTGRLVLPDNPNTYYEVLKVTIATDTRVVLNYGMLEVVFTVYPFVFISGADTAITSFPINNTGDICKPLYTISGTGSGELKVGNKPKMSFIADGTLNIDTRRFIAYKDTNQNRNDKLDGEYSDLWLDHGSNAITISNGFTLSVTPKWGYVI